MSISGAYLIEHGWPQSKAIGEALHYYHSQLQAGDDPQCILKRLEKVHRHPEIYADSAVEGPIARALIRHYAVEAPVLREEARPYGIWGVDLIDQNTIEQMNTAMKLPVAYTGALLPDAHLGYGLPVGGVLGTDPGVVIPWAVGVDIGPLRHDTKIPTLDGESYTVKELAEYGQEFFVWSCSPEGRITASKATARKTQRNAPLTRVHLDNGLHVDCTPDHRFMLRNGEYREAQNLSPGISLMPYYSTTDHEGYRRIKQNDSGFRQRAHWIVGRSGLMGEIPAFDLQRTIIHHKNFDQADNRPDNLEFMGDKDHSSYHRNLVERNLHWQSEEFEEKRIAALKSKAATPEGRAEFAERGRRLSQIMKDNPSLHRVYERTEKHREIAREIGSRMFQCEICGKEVKSRVALAGHTRTHLPNGAYNHMVVAVESLAEREDVYCLEVPGHENFALESGVFVHNCRMHMSLFDIPSHVLDETSYYDLLKGALITSTNFGPGGKFKPKRRSDHEVLADPLWESVGILRDTREMAEAQLGTSGGGNHFVEWGIYKGVDGSERLGLLSHSGSRGFGYKVANYFSKIAKRLHPKLPPEAKDLGWLDLSAEEGEMYWQCMQLAGDYARANHQIIHEKVARYICESPFHTVDHHHNYAWLENHGGVEMMVHRKGATPAKEGELGIIPGDTKRPGFVVSGTGNEESLQSASHGAGRTMSRTQANKTLDASAWKRELEQHRVELIGGGLDEASGAYKSVSEVLARQTDLVHIVGEFKPVLVRMAPSGAGKRRW